MPSEPISLIQWLGQHEYKEAAKVAEKYGHEVYLFHREVGSKGETETAIREWLDGNVNAQHCFLGTHGVRDGETHKILGIGATGDPGAFALWSEVWQWFDEAQQFRGGLWLGACCSSTAASAFTEFYNQSHQLLVPHIFGFNDEIYETEIEAILSKLIEFSRIDGSPDLDLQLKELRAAVPDTKIELFYPANDKQYRNRYINVDEFESEVGITFSEHLYNLANRQYNTDAR